MYGRLYVLHQAHAKQNREENKKSFVKREFLQNLHRRLASLGFTGFLERLCFLQLNGFGSLNSAVSGSGSSLAAGAQTPNSNMGSKHSWADVGLLLRERSDFSDLEFGPLIGTGSFGRVYKGIHLPTNSTNTSVTPINA